MSRKVVRLTLDHLEEFTAPCRSCLLWELDPVRRDRATDACAEKDAWVSQVLREWGSCGRVVLVDDVPAGYAMYAPEAFVPGAAGFPTAPVSSDAVLLTTVHVEPAYRGGGLARMLVQGMARDLVQRGGTGAIEAFGDPSRTRRSVPAAGGVPRQRGVQDAPCAPEHARGCGWTCAPPSPGRARSSPRSSGSSARCARNRHEARRRRRPGPRGTEARAEVR